MNREVRMNQYAAPDMPAIRAGLAKFNEVVAGRDYAFIPSLQERLTLAAQFLNRGTRDIIDDLRMLEVMVDNTDINAITEQYISLEASGLTREEQAPVIKRLATFFFEKANRIVSHVAETNIKIVHRISEVEGLNLEHYSDPLLAFDAAKLEALEQQSTAWLAEEAVLRTDKKAMVDAIAVLQSRTWLDHVTDVLPTPEQIEVLVSTVVVGKADAQLVKVALQRVTTYLKFIDGGVRLSSLVEARNKITDQLNILSAQLKKNSADARVLKAREAKILSHTALVEARAHWVDNMRRVPEGLEAFSARLRSTSVVSEAFMQQTSDELSELLVFLRQIRF